MIRTPFPRSVMRRILKLCRADGLYRVSPSRRKGLSPRQMLAAVYVCARARACETATEAIKLTNIPSRTGLSLLPSAAEDNFHGNYFVSAWFIDVLITTDARENRALCSCSASSYEFYKFCEKKFRSARQPGILHSRPRAEDRSGDAHWIKIRSCASSLSLSVSLSLTQSALRNQ